MTQYVGIPPDSTGKKIAHGVTVMLPVSGFSQTLPNSTKVVGQTSGATGYVVRHHDTGTSILEIILTYDSEIDFVVGENLMVGGVAKGVVGTGSESRYLPRNILSGANNPRNGAFVFADGAIAVRQTNLDAFNRVMFSTPLPLGEFTFQYDTKADEFEDIKVSGGDLVHRSTYAAIALMTPEANGARICRTSHTYFRYQPGMSQLILMTVAVGDVGKNNVVRRWGYFDDDNGVYFELDGTTLYAVIRSSASGVVTENRIPQNQWSKDRLDGQGGTLEGGITDYSLDVSKDNIFWIDFQWLGAGTVRFGIYHNGQRTVCHEEHHDGRMEHSYMRTGSLPIRWEQYNKALVSSGSEMKVFCATVFAEGNYRPSTLPFGRTHAGTETVTRTAETLDQWFVISSMRMKQLFKSRPNRAWGLPISMHLMSTNIPVTFGIIKNGTYQDADATELANKGAWGRDPHVDSAMEFDYVYEGLTGGQTLITQLMSQGKVEVLDLTQVFGVSKERVKRHADHTKYDAYAFAVKLLQPGTTDVFLSLNWEEVQ